MVHGILDSPGMNSIYIAHDRRVKDRLYALVSLADIAVQSNAGVLGKTYYRIEVGEAQQTHEEVSQVPHQQSVFVVLTH
jgi:hypothetical protein